MVQKSDETIMNISRKSELGNVQLCRPLRPLQDEAFHRKTVRGSTAETESPTAAP